MSGPTRTTPSPSGTFSRSGAIHWEQITHLALHQRAVSFGRCASEQDLPQGIATFGGHNPYRVTRRSHCSTLTLQTQIRLDALPHNPIVAGISGCFWTPCALRVQSVLAILSKTYI